MQVLVINLGSECFGILTNVVQEINNMVPITTVPNSLIYIRGLMNLRGNVVPVIDIKTYLQIESNKEEKNIVVMKIENQIFGIIVDDVEQVIEVSEESLKTEKDNAIIKINDTIITLLSEEHLREILGGVSFG